jgi:murein DD-endopeptidase MepM/ murein hydrolase activator NlpD
MAPDHLISHAEAMCSRRTFLKTGAALAAAAVFPALAHAGPRVGGAAAAVVNPYSGSIPLTFPLPSGTYQTPLSDNWHAAREGQLYQWNHRNATKRRAHDGVDIYPVATDPLSLPAVYAPVQGVVSAVCIRDTNTVNSNLTYRKSLTCPPPWDYSTAVDNVANLPLYGNFVWIYSTDPSSTGYFIFFCHLQNEPILQGLGQKLGQAIDITTQVGVLGDTGNASGTPQLHVEIHYPKGTTYSCSHCTPARTLTAIDPFASLNGAASRVALQFNRPMHELAVV